MTEYQLEFGYSSSPQYAVAVAVLQEIPGASTEGEGHRALHVAPLGAASDAHVRELLFYVSSWRSARIRAGGVVAPASALQRVRRVLGCGHEREESLFAEQYCWGVPFVQQRVPCRLFEEALPRWFDAGETPEHRQRVVAAIAADRFLALCPWFAAADVEAELERAAQRAQWRNSDDPIEQLFGVAGLRIEMGGRRVEPRPDIPPAL